jgi:protein SCO1/2
MGSFTHRRPVGRAETHPPPRQPAWSQTAGLLIALVMASSVLACGSLSPASPPPSGETLAFQPYVYDPADPAPPLDLTDQTDTPFTLDRLRGRTVLVSFGYTHCPDVCPTTLAIDRDVLLERPNDAAVVFVTIDPARDTPAALREYLKYFGASMTGLSGSDEETAQTANAWHVSYAKESASSADSYVMSHTAGTFVIDPDGSLRFLYPYGTPASALIAAVDRLSDE